MARFRKKPVEVEAWQFEAPQFMPQPGWFTGAMMAKKIYYHGGETPYYTIRTLEGMMRADPGDWIVRGVEGELYSVKPAIFTATYESAEDNPHG